MKNIKHRMEHFSFYDHTGMVRHLEKMAERGWLLESRTSFTWKYRRIEPKKLHFAVTYFPQASEFDPEPSSMQKTFEEYCSEAGWHHLISSAQMQIFVNEAEYPVPIETDALIQVETVHKAMKKNYLPVQFMMLLIGLLNMALFFARLFGDPIGVLVEKTNLFTFFCWTLVLFLALTELSSYFLWYRKAKKTAEESGWFIETHSHAKVNRTSLILLFFGFLYWIASSRTQRELIFILAGFLYIGILIFLVNGVKKLLKQKKVSAKVNRTATILSSFVFAFSTLGAFTYILMNSPGRNLVERPPAETYEYNGHIWEIYRDNIPLTVEDLTEVDESLYSKWQEEKSSPLIDQLKASQNGRLGTGNLPELSYTVNTIKIPVLYEFCLNGLMRRYTGRSHEPEEFRNRFVSIDPAPWEADAVYQLYQETSGRNWYLVCWGNKIVELNFSWEPAGEQIITAAKKLKSL